jgi:PAS domain-containing protein
MHRLVIVSGPNRGSSFSLIEGENSIGRQMDNHIVLSSTKVSKRHCALLVTPKEVYLRDEGSTNGTFVNGTMIRKLPLKPGDKIGIGEFVLELVSSVLARVDHQNDFSSPQTYQMSAALQPAAMSEPARQSTDLVMEVPQDLPGKVKYGFEAKLMPFFYGLILKNQYSSIVAILIGALTFAAVIGSLMPVVDLAEKSIQAEALIRSRVLAKEMVDRFSPAIANRAESQIDLSLLDREDSVKMAMIVDPNQQIIAPQSRIGQILGGGGEAIEATKALKYFKEGHEKGFARFINSSTVVSFEPIKVVDPRLLKHHFAAMALVSIDFSNNMLESGSLGVVYGIAFTIAGIVAALIYFILMRLTLKPFEVLNDDLDQVLRGELPKVTHEFKIEELDNLWNNINSAIQRISKSGSGGGDFGSETVVNWEQEFAPMRALCEAAQLGFIAIDASMVVVSMNAQFEEVSGIRGEGVGQAIQEIARDQSMVSLTKDLFERVQGSMTRSAVDDFEFSGVAYQVIGAGAGPQGQTGMAMIFKRKD